MPLTVQAVAPPTATQTGTLTAGSAAVTGLADTAPLAGAVRASGAGVPASTFVASVDSPTQVTLTSPATASGPVPLTFTVEPVSLAEAKNHLKQDFPDDDALVARLIASSRRYCEVVAKRTFIATTFKAVDDAFPFTGGVLNRQVRQFYGQFNGGQGVVFPGVFSLSCGVITLPRAPVVSVTSINYLDVSGNPQVLDPSVYTVTPGSPGRVAPVFGQIWPATCPQVGAVSVTFVAGYGPTSDSVPETDRAAVLLCLGHYYRLRSDAGAPPDGVRSLLGVEDNSGGYG